MRAVPRHAERAFIAAVVRDLNLDTATAALVVDYIRAEAVRMHLQASRDDLAAAELRADHAITRERYWRDRHAEACQRLAEHVCDDVCASGAHHDCPPAVCEWNGCDCPCHHLDETDT